MKEVRDLSQPIFRDSQRPFRIPLRKPYGPTIHHLKAMMSLLFALYLVTLTVLVYAIGLFLAYVFRPRPHGRDGKPR